MSWQKTKTQMPNTRGHMTKDKPMKTWQTYKGAEGRKQGIKQDSKTITK